MANKSLFSSLRSLFSRPSASADLPGTDAVNHAGGTAYAMSPEHKLAQLALTGTLNHTFYASAEAQLDAVMEAALAVEPAYLAQVAIYAREHGFMKDLPAMLVAVLVELDGERGERVFHRVIDNGKMLRNYVQIVRSGALGRKSFGSRPKRLVRDWLARRSGDALFRASVGNAPSFGDIVKMVHPKPKSEDHAALFAWWIGKPYKHADLPPLVQAFEAYKANPSVEVPDVPFEMLTALPLDTAAWTAIARRASWQMTRMNLNTFRRHGVFADPKLVRLVADRLADAEQVRRAKAFPYQLLMAAKAASHEPAIHDALHQALEVATSNVPGFDGEVVIAVDVSGSMGAPVTGHRQGATTAVRCVDVAALIAAAVVRKNPRAIVLPFEHRVIDFSIRADATVMDNATRLASIGGGGTDCAAPLARLVQVGKKIDVLWMISDNESWVQCARRGEASPVMRHWETLRARNPNAKMILLDIQPTTTTQARDRADILNIGGFSDDVFSVVKAFVSGRSEPRHLVEVIRREAA